MPFPVFFFSFVFGQFDTDWPLTYAAARLLSFLDPPTQVWDTSGRPASRPLPALSSLCVYVGVLGGDSRVSETLFPLRHSSFLLFFRLDNLSVSVKFADSSASSNLILSSFYRVFHLRSCFSSPEFWFACYSCHLFIGSFWSGGIGVPMLSLLAIFPCKRVCDFWDICFPGTVILVPRIPQGQFLLIPLLRVPCALMFHCRSHYSFLLLLKSGHLK